MVRYEEILKKYWGYSTFRPLQAEIIEAVAAGHDVVALMPTGGGKSVTYQVPAMAREGICIVVTPLVALMKDQVDTLRRKGILAVGIHSGLSYRQIDRLLDNCVYGGYKFLYVSPERVDNEMFRARVAKMNVSLIAVDEAHCISQWGYDFRPSYLSISRLRELAPDVPMMALTASATDKVIEEIKVYLAMRDPKVFRMSFLRENISYVVRTTDDKQAALLRVVNNVAGTGIVYVRTRKRSEDLAAMLVSKGITALHYHGGMVAELRSEHQERWMRGECRVMVATNAFGMGIDKPDVRFVVHHDMCDSLEGYYQESGRGGRDGKNAYAVLLSSPSDIDSSRKRMALEFPPIETIKEIYQQIFLHFMIPYEEGKGRAVAFNLYEFAFRYKYFVPMVVNAIKVLNLNGYMTLVDELDNPTRIKFIVTRDQLYTIKITNPNMDRFIGLLLRLYSGVFTDFTAISESHIATVLQIELRDVSSNLIELSRMRVINYIPGARTPVLFFHEERLPLTNLRISADSYERRKQIVLMKNEAMFDYATQESGCRSLMLQNHFGDLSTTPCGKCDLCRATANSAADVTNYRQKIMERLRESPCDIKQLVASIKGSAPEIVSEIELMLEEGVLKQNYNGIIDAANI